MFFSLSKPLMLQSWIVAVSYWTQTGLNKTKKKENKHVFPQILHTKSIHSPTLKAATTALREIDVFSL